MRQLNHCIETAEQADDGGKQKQSRSGNTQLYKDDAEQQKDNHRDVLQKIVTRHNFSADSLRSKILNGRIQRHDKQTAEKAESE